MAAHSVQIDSTYEGELRCRATHGPSGTVLFTDPPVDNCGKGESFSPTDLVATAMGTCMATTMAIFAQRHGVELKGMRISVQKEMVQVPSRRIGKLTTEIHVPLAEDHPQREILERAALTCPVHASLHPDMEKPIVFHWASA